MFDNRWTGERTSCLTITNFWSSRTICLHIDLHFIKYNTLCTSFRIRNFKKTHNYYHVNNLDKQNSSELFRTPYPKTLRIIIRLHHHNRGWYDEQAWFALDRREKRRQRSTKEKAIGKQNGRQILLASWTRHTAPHHHYCWEQSFGAHVGAAHLTCADGAGIWKILIWWKFHYLQRRCPTAAVVEWNGGRCRYAMKF